MAYQLQEINRRIQSDVTEFLAECDENYAQRVSLAADKILSNLEASPIVLLSGPSGSGKTTTAMKIAEELQRRGVNTHAVAMDNYFKTTNPKTAPRTPEGELDFESPLCLDMELLDRHFTALSRGEEILIPKYEFVRQMRNDSRGTPLRLGKNEIVVFEGKEEELLRLTACAEQGSEHPVARAIVEGAQERGLSLTRPEQFTAIPGHGIEAVIEGKRLLCGNHKLMEAKGIASEVAEQPRQRLSAKGNMLMYVAVDGKLAALLSARDKLKPSSVQAVSRLKDMGIEVVMLTGDNAATAQVIAKEAGIDHVIADVLPEHKAQEVAALKGEGHKVCMVGDGVNDAPALVSADVGMAIGGGTDVAVESASVVLMSGDLGAVPTAISLSRATVKNIKMNLFWAFGYNTAGIPVAAGLLYLFGGPLMNPMLAGAAMALSSVSVVSNALRLRKFQPS